MPTIYIYYLMYFNYYLLTKLYNVNCYSYSSDLIRTKHLIRLCLFFILDYLVTNIINLYFKFNINYIPCS